MLKPTLLSLVAKARFADAVQLLALASRTLRLGLARVLAGTRSSADAGSPLLASVSGSAHMVAAERPSAGRIAAAMTNAIFIGLAIAYAATTTAFGCSGGVSTGGGGTTPPNDPNRALGTYRVQGTFGESVSRIFFGYWFAGDNGISIPAAQAFRAAMIPIENTARVTIVPSSILYEETAVSLNTGQLVTVSVSGTWIYDGQTSIRVDWGSTFVTASTFPATPPFDVATVGTVLAGPIPSDFIFANDANWLEVISVQPGPLDATFVRDGS